MSRSEELAAGAMVGVGGCLTAVVIMVSLAIVLPLLLAVGGYFTGWVLSVVFPGAGEWVVRGANLVGLKLALGDLPAVGAFLGFAGSFFKASQTNRSSKK